MVSYEHKIKNIYLGGYKRQPTKNTILYYPLTSNSTVQDMSGNGLNGTKNGNITFGIGLSGVDCGHFSGDTGSYINVPHDSKMAQKTVTFSLWCASEDYNGNRGIFYKGPFNTGNGIYALANYNANGGNVDWRINNAENHINGFDGNILRTHLVVTFDGTEGKIYKDGEIIKTFSNSTDISSNTNVLYVGAYWNSSYCFKGYISDFIMENKIREDEDVKEYYKWSISKFYGDKLPSEYKKVKYIESNGTQWIDTLVTPTSNTKSQIKFMNKAVTGDVIYGMYNNNDNADYRFFNYQSAIYRDLNSSRVNGSSCGANNVYEFEIGNNYVKNVGASSNLVSGSTVSGYTGSSTITLNKSNSGGISQNRWYYVKIREGETLVRDFVPCYRKADGEIGLYDKVNNVFYTNSGTGTFTKGPDVLN